MQCRSRVRGFTFIELLMAVAIVGIISSIAVPAYFSYISKQKLRAAQTDLVALSLSMENYFQQQLSYPAATTTTAATVALFTGWSPAQTADFKYIISASASSSYTLQAVGTSTKFSSCTVQLTSANDRTLTSGCGFTTAWL